MLVAQSDARSSSVANSLINKAVERSYKDVWLGRSVACFLLYHSQSSERYAFEHPRIRQSFWYLAFWISHLLVLFTIQGTLSIVLNHFISKASMQTSSFFASVRLSQPYVASGHTKDFHSWIFTHSMSFIVTVRDISCFFHILVNIYTHIQIHIHTYMYLCVCACVCK